MKVHIGVDADSGLVHRPHTTATNESDVPHAHEVLHGQVVDDNYLDRRVVHGRSRCAAGASSTCP